MREAFRFSHSTFATITYPYKSIFFRNTKRTKRNRLALHIHTLILKKDLSTLITPILQNAARKGMVSPHEVYKIHSAPLSLRLWRNKFTLMEERGRHHHKNSTSSQCCRQPSVQETLH
ncbi:MULTISPECIES: hypothetical protein [unclassified Bartonella]|uniref:hypothetical protein n=1 Tax=unclassified Bartonella TaxID=2645622 RepID=UPI0035CEC7F2